MTALGSTMESARKKTIGNAVVAIAYLAFITWFLLMYSDSLSFFENLLLIFVSLLMAISLGILFFHVPEWVEIGISPITVKEVGGFRAVIWLTRIIALIGLFSIVLALYMYAENLTFWQNMAVVLLISILAGGVVVFIWVKWAIRLGSMEDTSGMFASIAEGGLSSRIQGTVVIGTAWLALTLLFLIFYPLGLDLFQSIGVFIVSVIALVGVLGILWIRWGIRIGKGMDPSGELTKLESRYLSARIIGTVAFGDFALCAVLLFLIFNPMGFSFLESLALLFISVILILMAIFAIWIGMKKNA